MIGVDILPPGLQAFAALRAEDEPWLPRAFHSPQDEALMAGPGSVVIYSEAGGGRSAMLRMLKRRSLSRHKKAALWLPVDWRPNPPEGDERRTQMTWRRTLLESVALGALQYFAWEPRRREALPAWGQAYLSAFILAFASPLLDVELMQLHEEAPEASRAWLRTLNRPEGDLLLPPETVRLFPLTQAIRRLVEVVKRAGVQGVWVFVDGFERWEADLDLDDVVIQGALQRFFSTLAYFDQPGFAFKMAAPLRWRRFLTRTHAVNTRRVAEFELQWDVDDLTDIVALRLALASEGRVTKLIDLCDAPDVVTWLQRYGGGNPRRWLRWTGDLYRIYLEEGGERPLSIAMWRRLRTQLAPRLRITPDKRVWVGSLEIKGLSESLYRVLEYLYVRDGEICSRKELFTQAYRPGEATYGWEGTMETVIWRLRQAIEPDPHHPIFLITERGRGVRLARTR